MIFEGFGMEGQTISKKNYEEIEDPRDTSNREISSRLGLKREGRRRGKLKKNNEGKSPQ